MASVYPSRLRDFSADNQWTPEHRAAIWAEADRILADPSFKKSRRCVVLFRRLIEHALEDGDEEGLKERTLGIEVFGREADYDTNTDPIVRMTANEIRKRLAQYYQSSGLDHEVHIRLVPGNYLPGFEFGIPVISSQIASEAHSKPENSLDSISETASSCANESRPEAAASPARRHSYRVLAGSVLAMAVLAGAVIAVLNWTNWRPWPRSNQYLLWAPLLNTPNPVIICVADPTLPQITDALNGNWTSGLADEIAGRKPPIVQVADTEMPLVPYVDAEVSTRVAGWFKEHGKPFRLARASRVTLEDFRHGPVVLVGAFDNVWNLALFSKLRFHVQIDPTTKDEWIEDLQNPNNREWKSTGKLLYSDSSVDYAIVTRVFDKDIGTWIIAAGGLGMHATEAAGDLLTDQELSQSLPEVVRSGNRNIQIVLKTTVIGGHTGVPQILAVHTW